MVIGSCTPLNMTWQETKSDESGLLKRLGRRLNRGELAHSDGQGLERSTLSALSLDTD